MRRARLLLFLLAVGFAAAPAHSDPLAAENAGKTSRRNVIILHTNDLHGHLTPWTGWEGDLKGRKVGGLGRLAGAIGEVRKEGGDSVLLIDAGDLLGDTMIADLTKGAALIKALNYLRYDAMTIGNHEPDFTAEVLKDRVAQADFPTVAANLFQREGGKPFVKPYVIKNVGGVRVGILGLAYPNTAKTTAAKNVSSLIFEEPTAAAKRNLPKMREDGAELTVVLSHLGLGGDKHLAQSVKGIDVIVGGHSHNRMEQAEKVGQTLIVQAGAHGSDLGRLDLNVEGGKITFHRRTLIPLVDGKAPRDAAADEFVKRLLVTHRKALDEVLGEAGDWLVRAQTLAGQDARKRDEESPVDSLFADILRKETNADIAFLPGVGYGVAIPKGTITAAQLRQLVPHEGKVVTLRLSGRKILEVLEQAIENTYSDDPATKVGGMIQLSGLRFEYDSTAKKGKRVVSIERTEGSWDASADYTVATNTMLAGGGHSYAAFAEGEKHEEHGSQYEMIRRWVRANSPVITPPRGRIRKLER